MATVSGLAIRATSAVSFRRTRRVSRSSSPLSTTRSALKLAMLAGSMKIVSPVLLVRWTTPWILWRKLTATGKTW